MVKVFCVSRLTSELARSRRLLGQHTVYRPEIMSDHPRRHRRGKKRSFSCLSLLIAIPAYRLHSTELRKQRVTLFEGLGWSLAEGGWHYVAFVPFLKTCVKKKRQRGYTE